MLYLLFAILSFSLVSCETTDVEKTTFDLPFIKEDTNHLKYEVKDVVLLHDINPKNILDKVVTSSNNDVAVLSWRHLFKDIQSGIPYKQLEQRLARWKSVHTHKSLIKQSEILVKMNNLESAKQLLYLVQEEDPNNLDSLFLLSIIFLKLEKYDLCFGTLQEIKSILTNKLRENELYIVEKYKYILALTYLKSGKVSTARNILQEILTKDSRFEPAYIALINSYIDHDELALANYVIKRTIERVGVSPEIMNLQAVVNIKLKKYDNATTFVNKALKLNSKYVPAFNNAALLKFIMGKYSASEKFLHKSLIYQPNNSSTLLLLAKVYSKQGKLKKAMTVLKNAVDRDPKNIKLRFQLALVFLKSDRSRVRSRKLFKEIISMTKRESKLHQHSIHYSNYIDNIR